MESIPWGPVKCLYKHVVVTYRLVFKAGLTVYFFYWKQWSQAQKSQKGNNLVIVKYYWLKVLSKISPVSFNQYSGTIKKNKVQKWT